MKVINIKDPIDFETARKLEQDGAYKKAAILYEKLFRQSPKKLPIIERLLVVYRRLKDVAKEVKYIDAAIDIHSRQYQVKPGADKKLTALSKKLNALLGHTDKKGINILLPPEVTKLQARKERLLKSSNHTVKKK